jgi:hypothetical protein
MDIRTSKWPRFCHVTTGSAAFVAASRSGHSGAGNVGDTAAALTATDTDAAKIVDSALIDSPPV